MEMPDTELEQPKLTDLIYVRINSDENVWCDFVAHPTAIFTEQNQPYYHSRIVESLRRENEERQAKLDKAKDALDVAEWALFLVNNVRTVKYTDQKHIKDALETIKFTKEQRARTTLEDI